MSGGNARMIHPATCRPGPRCSPPFLSISALLHGSREVRCGLFKTKTNLHRTSPHHRAALFCFSWGSALPGTLSNTGGLWEVEADAGQVQQPWGLLDTERLGRSGETGHRTWTACPDRWQIGGLSGLLGSTKSLQF